MHRPVAAAHSCQSGQAPATTSGPHGNWASLPPGWLQVHHLADAEPELAAELGDLLQGISDGQPEGEALPHRRVSQAHSEDAISVAPLRRSPSPGQGHDGATPNGTSGSVSAPPDPCVELLALHARCLRCCRWAGAEWWLCCRRCRSLRLPPCQMRWVGAQVVLCIADCIAAGSSSGELCGKSVHVTTIV